jgi:hypothetical protein
VHELKRFEESETLATYCLYVVLFICSLFNDAVSNVEWVDDSEVTGVWEGNGRGQFKAVSWNLPGGTQVNAQYNYPAPFTSRVWFVEQFYIF